MYNYLNLPKMYHYIVLFDYLMDLIYLSGVVGRAVLRWVGPRIGAAWRTALVPCRPRFWVRGSGLGGLECGAHRGAGPAEGSDILSVDGFVQSEE